MLEIKGWVKTSFLDWDGFITSTLFLPNCNLRCPFCHNCDLVLNPQKLDNIPINEILKFLKGKRDWIDGVCISGGEPCLNRDLQKLLDTLRELNIKIKLDTNGTFPEVLEELIKADLVDYLAIDIKASLEDNKYETLTRSKDKSIKSKVKKTIDIIINCGKDYEFRTTIVPTIHTETEIGKIAAEIKGAKKYVLQKFKPQNTIDENFMNIKTFTDEEMSNFLQLASPYVKNCSLRG